MEANKPVTVITSDGQRGFIDTLQEPGSSSTGMAFVQLESGRQVRVPEELLELQPDGIYFLPVDLSTWGQGDSATQQETVLVVPVIAEELDIRKREQITGRVRVSKRIHERDETIDRHVYTEEVDVERIPINQPLEGPVSARQEGDTLIIPVLEEVLVVEKRLILKEEVRITKWRTETREPQQVKLREEEVLVERFEGEAQPEPPIISGENPENKETN